MRIIVNQLKRRTLADFADEHGLDLTVSERSPESFAGRWNESMRYYAWFKHGEISDGSVLISSSGDGATIIEAAENYARAISGKKLVFNAYDKDRRREILVPELTGL